MARDDLHFRLRIPEELKKKVEEAASKNQRSMTAEIIDRLEHSFKEWPRISLPNNLVTRAKRARTDRRIALEKEIDQVVKNTIERMLPDQGALHGDLLDTLYRALEEVPKAKRDALVADVRDVWGKITAATRGE